MIDLALYLTVSFVMYTVAYELFILQLHLLIYVLGFIRFLNIKYRAVLCILWLRYSIQFI
jgi:hypothetical protein